MIAMARYKDFKPDKPRSGTMSKLFLTKLQRRAILKWGLYALLLVALSVVQDVFLCRVRLFGATTELVIVGIYLICLAEGAEHGSVFSLVAALLYLFSGSAAGNYSIVFITGLSIAVTLFRQSYLQKNFAAAMLCTTFAVLVYEMAVFFIGVFLGMTTWGRIFSHFLTGVYSLVFAPALYPVVKAISAISDANQS